MWLIIGLLVFFFVISRIKIEKVNKVKGCKLHVWIREEGREGFICETCRMVPNDPGMYTDE